MDAIILAAGVGARAKLNYPKQFFRIGEKPLLIYTLNLFINNSNIDNIYVTVIPGEKKSFERLMHVYGYDNVKLIDGGKTRQESVFNALHHVKSDRVIIHEAVRPFITQDLINKLVETEGNAVVPVVDIIPTVIVKKIGYIDRDKLANIQLPQVFDTDILKTAHEKAIGKTYSDDSSLVYGELNILPILIDGLEENIKITTPFDIKVSEVLYEEISNSNWR